MDDNLVTVYGDNSPPEKKFTGYSFIAPNGNREYYKTKSDIYDNLGGFNTFEIWRLKLKMTILEAFVWLARKGLITKEGKFITIEWNIK